MRSAREDANSSIGSSQTTSAASPMAMSSEVVPTMRVMLIAPAPTKQSSGSPSSGSKQSTYWLNAPDQSPSPPEIVASYCVPSTNVKFIPPAAVSSKSSPMA